MGEGPRLLDSRITGEGGGVFTGVDRENYPHAGNVAGVTHTGRMAECQPQWLTDMQAATDEAVTRILRGDPPPCEHQYCHRQGYAICFGVAAAQMDMFGYAKLF